MSDGNRRLLRTEEIKKLVNLNSNESKNNIDFSILFFQQNDILGKENDELKTKKFEQAKMIEMLMSNLRDIR